MNAWPHFQQKPTVMGILCRSLWTFSHLLCDWIGWCKAMGPGLSDLRISSSSDLLLFNPGDYINSLTDLISWRWYRYQCRQRSWVVGVVKEITVPVISYFPVMCYSGYWADSRQPVGIAYLISEENVLCKGRSHFPLSIRYWSSYIKPLS